MPKLYPIRIFNLCAFLLGFVFLLTTSDKAWSQILPDNGGPTGQSFVKVDSEFLENLKRGTLKSIACGMKYRPYNQCHQLTPQDKSQSKICFISSGTDKFNRDIPIAEQIITYWAKETSPDGLRGGVLYYWVGIKRPEQDFKSSEVSANGWVQVDVAGSTIDCETPQEKTPISTIDSVRLEEVFWRSSAIDNCLLAERKLNNTSTSYHFNRIRFFCFPQATLADAKDLDGVLKSELSKRYFKYNENNTVYGLANDAPNETGFKTPAKCHKQFRQRVITSEDAAQFYKRTSSKPEIPVGHSVLAFVVEDNRCEAELK